MNIELLKDGTTLTVKPDGRLDTATAPELDRRMKPEIEGMTDIILDLEKVDYISSAGLRVLMIMYKSIQDKSRFEMTGVRPLVKEILESTGFDQFLL